MSEGLPESDDCIICGEFAWYDDSDAHDAADLQEMKSWGNVPTATYTEFLP